MLTNRNLITYKAVLGKWTLITGTVQHFTLWKTQSLWLNGKKDEALTTWWTVYHYPQALILVWNFSPLICMLGLENTLLYVFRALHYFANPFLQTSRSQVTRKNKCICTVRNELTSRMTKMIWMWFWEKYETVSSWSILRSCERDYWQQQKNRCVLFSKASFTLPGITQRQLMGGLTIINDDWQPITWLCTLIRFSWACAPESYWEMKL